MPLEDSPSSPSLPLFPNVPTSIHFLPLLLVLILGYTFGPQSFSLLEYYLLFGVTCRPMVGSQVETPSSPR